MSNRQAVANLVKAVASYREAKSVVELSKSPVFHHQFSSISKAIANLATNQHELKRVRKLFREHRLKYFSSRARNYLQTDVVNIFRSHSPSLIASESQERGGAPQIYGTQYYLIEACA